MRQTTFAEGSFVKYKKPTRKEIFLAQMDEIIPWKQLSKVIEPHYPKPSGSGRRPIGIERMLRIHFMQHWFNLSDPGIEEALYDMAVLRAFAGIDLGEWLLHLVKEYLSENGLFVPKGTIMDATLIEAPTSTRNKPRQRDRRCIMRKRETSGTFA